MHASLIRSSRTRRLLAVLAFLSVAGFSTANAAILTYTATLTGPNESPPNASPGTGTAQVDVDDVANTMTVQATFTGLTGTMTNAHIHAPTTTAGTGVANVATQTPTFPGFPSGVMSGGYGPTTFDMTLTSSYSAMYLADNGGTAAGARAALFQALADGKAYFNIHSTTFGGGEIRGFLTFLIPVEISHFSID